MEFTPTALLLAFALLAAMLVCIEAGHRIGRRRAAEAGDAAPAGFGVVEGAVFALLGLLIAFTFSGALSRFDERRQLIVDEANAIGTAYLRIDLLPGDAQPALREKFRNYLDARLAVYRAVPDMKAVEAELARANAIQQEIWRQSLERAPAGPSATMLLLPALNEMFDIATTRTMAVRMHPPTVVFALLFGFALLGAVLAGNAMATVPGRHWLHSAAFAFALAGAVYVIIDMEYPRLGFIRVDSFDQVLIDLRQSMR
jgi:hypothetical protein